MKVAIITGSTRGIGLAIAQKLAEEGIAVVINGRNKDRVEQVVQDIQNRGGKACGVAGEIQKEETSEKLVKKAMETFGRIDILINNAGIVHDKISYKMSIEEWDEVINVHLRGAFLCTKCVVNEMKKHEANGTVINMISTAGLEGVIGQLNYSAAKAGLMGMTMTLAKELKNKNISVIAIAPAALTDMTKPYVERAIKEAKRKGTAIDSYWNIGSPEDIAEFIYRLLQQNTLEYTGEIFQVNGQEVYRWLPPKRIDVPFSFK